jgi:hypothetical protein
MLSKETRESLDVTVDHRFNGRFELRDRRSVNGDGVNVFLEAPPISEIVPTRNRQLRIGSIKGSIPDVGFGQFPGKPGIIRTQELRMFVHGEPHRIAVLSVPTL